MSDLVMELAERGRTLDPKDRERLVDLLLDSLEEAPDPSVEEAWRLEIRRRVAAYERGESTLFDADEVMAEARLLAR
ncbi:MAG: addiction module protein [Burkholderiales bacterium]|nr:addiction module protein [Burkholderiales bacterium]